MILTIDMGNSNIVLSLFKNDKLIKSFRLLTDKEQNEKYYENKLTEAFKENNININNIKGIVFSSVVPFALWAPSSGFPCPASKTITLSVTGVDEVSAVFST